MDTLTQLLKRGCEVSIEASPALCPRKKHTYVVEVYHQRSQRVYSSTSAVSLEDALALVDKQWWADPPN